MTEHRIGTQKEWQAEREALLKEEKELTRRVASANRRAGRDFPILGPAVDNKSRARVDHSVEKRGQKFHLIGSTDQPPAKVARTDRARYHLGLRAEAWSIYGAERARPVATGRNGRARKRLK